MNWCDEYGNIWLMTRYDIHVFTTLHYIQGRLLHIEVHIEGEGKIYR